MQNMLFGDMDDGHDAEEAKRRRKETEAEYLQRKRDLAERMETTDREGEQGCDTNTTQ